MNKRSYKLTTPVAIYKKKKRTKQKNCPRKLKALEKAILPSVSGVVLS